MFKSIKLDIIDGLNTNLPARIKFLVNKEFPDYMPALEEFESMITWKRANGKRIPEPKKGLFEEFDTKNQDVERVKA